MPAYEYECEECQKVFVDIQTFAEHEEHRPVKCPKCGSEKVHQLISSVHVQTSKKS